MIDLFFCSVPLDNVRLGLSIACLSRWQMEEGINLRVLTASGTQCQGEEICERKEFSWKRRLYADHNASSDIYIIAEDDCMPLGPDFVLKGLETFTRHPEFVAMMACPLGANYADDVTETNSAGDCISFIRKGSLNLLRGRDGIDQYLCYTAQELKCGVMLDPKFNHLGYGLSTVWPDAYETGLTKINEIRA